MKSLPIILAIFVFIFSSPQLAYADPSSTHYDLKNFSFGSGGTASSSSTTYKTNAISGEVSGDNSSSSTYKTKTGLNQTLQANVPPAPTFTNPSHYYNKLKLVLNNGGNASDATFAIAISTDNFSSDTKYVQSDNTVGSTLGSEDWQSYSTWGGASGLYVIGLTHGTTYTVKVEAQHGNFTQTGFGPTAQAATENESLSFDIDVAPTDTETSAPYSVSLGSLTAGSVTTASDKVWVDIDTNGPSGASVYVQGSNNGLLSSAAGYTISSTTTDLGSASEGYGAQGDSVAQTSGGPLEVNSPYNGSSNNVGALSTTQQIIFDSSGAAITAGRGSFSIKAKASIVTKAAQDYADTLTLVASAAF